MLPSSASFRTGVVIVQATEQFIVDLLDPTLQNVPGGANGETGAAFSVEIGFYTTVNNYNEMAVVVADGGAIKTLPAPLAANGQRGRPIWPGKRPRRGRSSILPDGCRSPARSSRRALPSTFVDALGGLRERRPLSRMWKRPRVHDDQRSVAASGQSIALGSTRPTFVTCASAPRAGCRRRRRADAGPTVVSAGDGGVDAGSPVAIAGAPCAPTAGTVYDWADTNPFNSAVLGEGMKRATGLSVQPRGAMTWRP